jgi:hypothetical protein
MAKKAIKSEEDGFGAEVSDDEKEEEEGDDEETEEEEW